MKLSLSSLLLLGALSTCLKGADGKVATPTLSEEGAQKIGSSNITTKAAAQDDFKPDKKQWIIPDDIGGELFDDGVDRNLVKVELSVGDWGGEEESLKGIRAFYHDDDGADHGAAVSVHDHGFGNTRLNDRTESLHLLGGLKKIVHVTMCTGSWGNEPDLLVIRSIAFTTDDGITHGPFGSSVASVHNCTELKEDGKYVSGFYGRAGDVVEKLGLHWTEDRTTGLESYEFLSIPSQVVWHGQVLEFLVDHSNGTNGTNGTSIMNKTGSSTLKLQPKRENLRYLDWNESFGIFQYKPDVTDKLEFPVTLTHVSSGRNVTFGVTPMPVLPPEASIISSTFPSNDPDGDTGLFELSCQDAGKKVFNTVERNVKKCRIVAEKDLELDGIFQSDPPDDIEEVAVYAETITLASRVHFAQTNLIVYAKNLHLLHANAQIVTTPKSIGHRAADIGQDGVAGHNGGSIALHVGSITFPCPEERPCGPYFVTRGGKGQEQGPGRNGVNGKSNLSCRGDKNCEFGGNIFHDHEIIYKYVKHDKDDSPDPSPTTHGARDWPTSGTNAVRAGRPGKGGNGGDFFSTFPVDLEKAVDTKGGLSGEDPTNENKYFYEGGRAGLPIKSTQVYEVWYYECKFSLGWCTGHRDPKPPARNRRAIEYQGKEFVETRDGADAIHRDGWNSPGVAGSIAAAIRLDGKVDSSTAWLHPFIVDKALTRAERFYRLGDMARAKTILSEYQADLERLFRSSEVTAIPDKGYVGCEAAEIDEIDLLSDLLAAKTSMSTILARIESNLDFYGNEGGWVPLLSFDVLGGLAEQEIRGSFETLYLVYWLQRSTSTVEEREVSLVGLVDKLQVENTQLESELEQFIDSVPTLKHELKTTVVSTAELQRELTLIEERLVQRAVDDVEERNKTPWWKKGLKVASSVLRVIPVGQPKLQAVASVADLAADTDFSNPDPLDIALSTIDIYGDYQAAKAQEIIDGEKPVNPNATAFKDRADWASAASASTRDIATTLRKMEVPMSEVEAAIETLKAESVEFQDIATRIRSLVNRRSVLASNLKTTLQGISDHSRKFQENLLAIDSANGDLLNLGSLNSGRLAMYLQRIKNSAFERVLKYQYYFSKAAEYRLLRPYEIDFDSVDIEEMIALHEVAQTSPSSQELLPEQFDSLQSVYLEELKRTADTVIDELVQEGRTETSTSVKFWLTPDEIAKLNQESLVTLNPMSKGLFRLDESNIRITGLSVEEVEFRKEETTATEGDIEFIGVHSGLSFFREEGELYMFHHSPVPVGGAKYHFKDDSIAQVVPSAASQPLLMSLLDNPDDDVLLFSRPGALSDIHLRVASAQQSGIATLEKLKLKLSYDRTLSKLEFGDPIILGIQAKNLRSNRTEILPYFVIDKRDMNNRTDGRGEFYRAYETSQERLKVTTQVRFGDTLFFDHWRVTANRETKTFSGPDLLMDLNAHTEIVAYFREAGEEEEPVPVPVPTQITDQSGSAVFGGKQIFSLLCCGLFVGLSTSL